MRTLVGTLVVLLLTQGLGLAQETAQTGPGDRFLVGIHGISQQATATAAATLGFAVYEEDGTSQLSQQYGRVAGFWIESGCRFWRNAYAGVAYSRSTGTGRASVSMSVPHPLISNEPRSATRSIDGAKQSVEGIHLWAAWRLPLKGSFDVLLSAGPSFVKLRRDTATGATFEEGPEPFTTISVGNVTMERRSKSVVGGQVGAALTFRITRSLGATGCVRYVHAKPALDGAAGASKTSVGGLTAGGGLRLLF